MADRGKDDPNIGKAPQSGPGGPGDPSVGKAAAVRGARSGADDPMVKMQHATDTGDYTLMIGADSYEVKGGAVEVPMSQVSAAEAAGFHTV
jgi:hypothetical protein